MTLNFPEVLVLKPAVALKLTLGLPCPLLVVMMITPFAALEPYKPVTAASLRTVTDSTSLGLTIPPTIPSTTYNGAEAAEMDPEPRMIGVGATLGSPVALDTITPATFPCNKLLTLLDVTSLSCLPETTETDPDILDSSLEEYPITTTSFS